MTKDLKKYLALLFMSIFTVAGISIAKDISLPQGWRIPAGLEITDEWRNESENKYLEAKGDFNGDGRPDSARILIGKDSELGLYVFLNEKSHFEEVLLETIQDKNAIHFTGIRKASPGHYRTACGKGYWDCEKDEVPEIELKNDAIDFFANESANSFFYWDVKTKSFKRIWISD